MRIKTVRWGVYEMRYWPVFKIISYHENENQWDASISVLLKAVYVDAGFTAPQVVPRGFSSAEIKQRGKILLAIDTENNLIGMIIVGTQLNPFKQVATSEEAEMQLLGTLPLARGKGVGEALCRAFEAEALADGFRSAVLSTQPMMETAHKLYLKLGYTRNPARDWSRNDREFLVFQKNLKPPLL